MKISSGSRVFDELLEGGYDRDVITMIYGPAATGKTTACLLAAVEAAKKGKVVFVDTENSFSVERLKQLTANYEKILDNIFLIKIDSFEKQNEKIDFIFNLINKTKIDLIMIDTIGAHYRNILQSDVKKINNQMANQLDILTKIARDFNIPVILTNQVYGMLGEKGKVNIVGGDMLKNYSSCLIELKKFKASNRGAILKKHKNLKEKEVVFKIVERGFTSINH